MQNALEWILVLPPLFLIAAAAFHVWKFNRTQKNATLANQILVAFLGPFVLGSKNVLNDVAKTHLRKFYFFGFLFVIYLSGLSLLAIPTMR